VCGVKVPSSGQLPAAADFLLCQNNSQEDDSHLIEALREGKEESKGLWTGVRAHQKIKRLICPAEQKTGHQQLY